MIGKEAENGDSNLKKKLTGDSRTAWVWSTQGHFWAVFLVVSLSATCPWWFGSAEAALWMRILVCVPAPPTPLRGRLHGGQHLIFMAKVPCAVPGPAQPSSGGPQGLIPSHLSHPSPHAGLISSCLSASFLAALRPSRTFVLAAGLCAWAPCSRCFVLPDHSVTQPSLKICEGGDVILRCFYLLNHTSTLIFALCSTLI